MNFDRQAWLAKRQTGIGGSDIARVLGLSPFGTPLDVWLEKTQPILDREPNEAMRWGTLLEEPVANEYARRQSVTLQRVRPIVRAAKRPWALAAIDRAIREGASTVRTRSAGGLTGARGLLNARRPRGSSPTNGATMIGPRFPSTTPRKAPGTWA